ncbi:trypsin-like serine peptidase [Rudaeicoccus suwonensis]|uniref:Peptidase S1 domain-containing protein n=1 Tax=Rudaeicoccus suwonensis TaxID=657409 RepID=A0A561E478_9MICO|nr:serine protease [Rudaeicoccus suwonensis]TWE10418.1 hypothetical protein BKA23_2779 [Rudaeicoccus suwonensis]
MMVIPGLALAFTLAASTVTAPVTSSAPAGVPVSVHTSGNATVGALFTSGNAGGKHSCTASVVASSTQNLIVTAAHCVSGTGAGMTFSPGYDNGDSPYGVWRVTAAYVSSAWNNGGDTDDDVAILKVAPNTVDGVTEQVQQVVGSNALVGAPTTGTSVTVTGYNAGSGDQAITCTTPVTLTGDSPTFTCGGYVGGTSGSPFLVDDNGTSEVSGVIGGLHQGGCTDWTSYSAPFGNQVTELVQRAESVAAGDVVAGAGSDGC